MKIEIYGKDNCAFCDRAKKVCDANSIEYTYYNMSMNESYKDTMLKRASEPVKTVPQIFIDGSHVPGGFEALNNFIIENF